jgi:hypothetical protein
MRLPRITIAGLMAFIALVGISFSTLLVETESWARMMLTLALVSSGVALLGRLLTRGTAKAGWTGYLVFGAGYLTLCIGPWCDEHIMPNLATTPFIDERYSTRQYTPTLDGERVWTCDGPGRGFSGGTVFGPVGPEIVSFDVAHDRGTTSRYNPTQLRAISPDGHRRLCHSTISFWTGLLGMLLARYFVGRHREEPIRGAASEPT